MKSFAGESSYHQRWYLLGRLAVLALVAGCVADGGVSNRASERTDARVQMQDWNASMVDDRYLVMPIGPERDMDEVGFGSGVSLGSFSSSAGRRDAADIIVVDLTSGKSKRLFDKMVWIDAWLLYRDHSDRKTRGEYYYSGSPPTHSNVLFDNQLILTAVCEDTNQDGHIDLKDRESMYAFDMATFEMKELCPRDARLSEHFRRGDRLVLTVRRSGAAGLSIYEVDPKSAEGRWVTSDPLR
ncbi:MAG TPA: hypothetical protein P5081_18905 [Phycisphaerae bacterium]|nr:hypothetical protein [Phycisphaerae bacterium]HRW54943.1 hypothetical protein [Phycisphaerae bacterium]